MTSRRPPVRGAREAVTLPGFREESGEHGHAQPGRDRAGGPDLGTRVAPARATRAVDHLPVHPSTRIVLDPATSWAATGATVADDLHALTDIRPTVVFGPEAATTAGDLYLTLGSADTSLGDEGYRMEVGGVLKIRARAVAGAFHGTRGVLRLLRRSGTITGDAARDLTAGDEPVPHPTPWWENLVRDRGYGRLNGLTPMVCGRGLTDAEIAVLVGRDDRHPVPLTP
ncbi:glycoside hydrolase family 20 zincin-like fold domain-containing protein [Actinosynnema sp. NPDC020468]|uniref:glycoside hydrolase family 20 zincin-like fold domain-containing protein n=1 Tax=Actinosynnema sp. NPDC020468 TaxID=3154488 RepID=UPI0033C29363